MLCCFPVDGVAEAFVFFAVTGVLAGVALGFSPMVAESRNQLAIEYRKQ